MRLTLRTMLAYLDNVLEPNESEELGHKIRESRFAGELVDLIRSVSGKVRMDAPKVDGKGMGHDANTVSEYLDSALPQDRVGDFERVCLESNKHLAEVAGKPVDLSAAQHVPPVPLRQARSERGLHQEEAWAERGPEEGRDHPRLQEERVPGPKVSCRGIGGPVISSL